MARAGQKWNEMTPAEKQTYDDLSAKDKSRYEKQLKSFETNGFYILEDGSKSTDEKNLPAAYKRQLSKAKQSLSSDKQEDQPKRKS